MKHIRKISLLSSAFLLAMLLFPHLQLESRDFFAPNFYPQSEYPPLVSPDMKRPGFWISRHPAPDSTIMDAKAIKEFNRYVQKKGSVTQIIEHSKIINGNTLKKMINDAYITAKAQGIYDSIGTYTPNAFWQDTKQNLNLEKIKASTQVRFAFPLRFTSQRLAPSSANMNKKALDVEFDELQNSGYDIGTPTVIYHTSKDGLWAFGASSISVGWYQLKDIAFVSHTKWVDFQKPLKWIVSTEAKSDLYSDSTATQYLCFLRMGVKLPLVREYQDFYEVLIPTDSLRTAYISKHDAHQGYLPYTARNIYLQAFKLLNIPYGWGDMGGEYDCSGLIKQLFACFGIYLPRNGAQQEKAGKPLHSFKDGSNGREEIIAKHASPGTTLLRLPGHIMLYLGSVNGKAYALHDTWGRREPNAWDDDDVYVINKTVVSDLYLSKGSKRGSLLQRLSGFSDVRW